jgi:hypothetical protein
MTRIYTSPELISALKALARAEEQIEQLENGKNPEPAALEATGSGQVAPANPKPAQGGLLQQKPERADASPSGARTEKSPPSPAPARRRETKSACRRTPAGDGN